MELERNLPRLTPESGIAKAFVIPSEAGIQSPIRHHSPWSRSLGRFARSG
jgi:hypothetical protein